MAQRLNAGSSAVKTVYAGSSLVKRVFDGTSGNLLYEHPNFPTLDFAGGALPGPATVPSAGKAQVTYARTGVAYAWQAGSLLPTLVQVAVDTPRFSVCPPGVEYSIVGNALGLIFEPERTNILPYGRATATGWTSTNVTAGTATGIDDASNAARTLTATAANGLHYRTTPPSSQTARWVLLGVGQADHRHGQGVDDAEGRASRSTSAPRWPTSISTDRTTTNTPGRGSMSQFPAPARGMATSTPAIGSASASTRAATRSPSMRFNSKLASIRRAKSSMPRQL